MYTLGRGHAHPTGGTGAARAGGHVPGYRPRQPPWSQSPLYLGERHYIGCDGNGLRIPSAWSGTGATGSELAAVYKGQASHLQCYVSPCPSPSVSVNICPDDLMSMLGADMLISPGFWLRPAVRPNKPVSCTIPGHRLPVYHDVQHGGQSNSQSSTRSDAGPGEVIERY